MLKHKLRLFAIVLLMSAANTALAQVNPVKDSTKAIADTTLEEAKDAVLDNIPVVSLDENDDQDGSAQNLSSQLNSGRNPFINAASFNFNVVRFRIRGYDADQFSTYMNGVPMENLDNGFTPFGLWGGLNDVLRNRQYTPGLQATSFGYGGLGGSTNIDTRAFRQRKQTAITYANTNRTYNNRLALTHSTGWSKKGWAFSFSGSHRWANESYADGTFYDGWSFYAAADKRINSRNIISLVAFATPTEIGRQGPSVNEIRDIVGTNYYNPYWGYQNGQKRNANIGKTFQPFAILTHEWKISDRSGLVTAASFSSGKRSTSNLDWFNAADPRPDYYRYLPSYQDDPAMAERVKFQLQNDVNRRQINWDALYNTNYGNYETIENENGVLGNNVSGKRSLYIVEERVIHTNRFNFNTTYNTAVNSHVDISTGFTFESQVNNYYKEINDLLGGDFYVDVDQFAERDFPANPSAGQNDLNHPNRVLRKGDKFGYNYNINITRGTVWAQANVKLRKLNFFVSGMNSFTNYYRVGHVRKGLFPNDSEGKSDEANFSNYSIKAGLTHLVTAHNYVFANAAYETRAPFFENAFLSPRTRNQLRPDLKSEHITSFEAGYVLVSPIVKFRATGYYTIFKRGVDILTFYNDLARTLANYSINNIGKANLGVEIGAEVILYKGLTLQTAANIGRYKYTTTQNAVLTVDNSSTVFSSEAVYAKGFNQAVPQQAYTVGLNYRSPKFWYLNVNFNYFDQMYLQFSPVRRTTAAVDGLEPDSKEWHNIVDQTQLKAQHTLDALLGYSWLMNKRFKSLGKRTFLVFNVGVNNILNNRTIVSGGFEQLRYDFVEKDPQKFADKRYFAFGRNFQASVALRF
ncbi:MAG: TonB-dependent receptor [Ferruginibacter sp.]